MCDTKSSHKSAPRRVRQQEQHSFPSARERRRYISSGCEFYLAFLYRRHLAIPVSFIFLQKNCLPSREDGTSGQVENRRVLLFFLFVFFKPSTQNSFPQSAGKGSLCYWALGGEVVRLWELASGRDHSTPRVLFLSASSFLAVVKRYPKQ